MFLIKKNKRKTLNLDILGIFGKRMENYMELSMDACEQCMREGFCLNFVVFKFNRRKSYIVHKVLSFTNFLCAGERDKNM